MATLTDILKVGGNIVVNTLTGGLGSGLIAAANALLGDDKKISPEDTVEIAQGKINTLPTEQQEMVYNHLEVMASIEANREIKALALREQTTKYNQVRPNIARMAAWVTLLPIFLINLILTYRYYTTGTIIDPDFFLYLNGYPILLVMGFMGIRSFDKLTVLRAQHSSFGSQKTSFLSKFISGNKHG